MEGRGPWNVSVGLCAGLVLSRFDVSAKFLIESVDFLYIRHSWAMKAKSVCYLFAFLNQIVFFDQFGEDSGVLVYGFCTVQSYSS